MRLLPRLASSAVRHRPGRGPGGLIAAGGVVAAVAALAGCAAPVAGTGASAAVPPGTTLFRSLRPGSADCNRIDLGQLGRLSAVAPPRGTAELKQVDGRPDRIWASCVGRAPVIRAADGSTSGGGPIWLVSFATSPAATSDSERMATKDAAAGYRTLVRRGRLGDAPAQVVMDVHEDDHLTLLVVTVFDPVTGRPAARCGLASALGDRADDAANWCLKALSDQLQRPPSPVRVGSVPVPSAAAAAAADPAQVGSTAGPTDSAAPSPS